MSEVQGNENAGIAGARKDDGGKAPIYRGGLLYFGRAIALASQVSEFGATKYAWNGWKHVPDGFNRYSDAMLRHLVKEGQGEILDPDSGLPNIGHTLWNSLARTELYLINEELRKSL